MVGGVSLGNAGEHVARPSFGVDEVDPDGLNKRIDRRCLFASLVGTGEEVVLAAECHGSKALIDAVHGMQAAKAPGRCIQRKRLSKLVVATRVSCVETAH